MKRIGLLTLSLFSLLVIGCTKTDLPPQHLDPDEWMQTHQRGEIAYTDFFSGNYIVQTRQGFSVIENWGGVVPRDFDVVYGHFQFTGLQTIYNRSGNYFTQGKIVGTWLTWFEAMELLEFISR